MTKRLLVVFALVMLSYSLFAQTENDAIKKTISTMFDAMRKGDSAMLHSVFAEGLVLQSVVNKKDGTTKLVTDNPGDFLTAVGTPHKEVWDERITWGDIKVDANLASVWTPYKFYLDDKLNHCGVNFFQLMKTIAGDWKIIYIVDTRRKDNCPE